MMRRPADWSSPAPGYLLRDFEDLDDLEDFEGLEDLEDLRTFCVSAAIRSPRCEVVVGRFLPGRSEVRAPRFRTFSTAVSIASASLSMRNECRSIIAADMMAPTGLARLRPAMEGAEPCTGS